jgi:tetratricopeptide (TPR) repeat protein
MIVAFNRNKVMEAARKAVEKGQLDKAIKEYEKVVKEDPSDVRVWLKIGDLHAKKGSKQEASATYQRVAEYYRDQGFFLKAVAVYKQILKIEPQLVDINIKLAELYRQLGLMSDAVQHYEMVAAFHHREGKTKEALDTIRQLVELDPENVATRIKLAELYSKEGMVEQAVTEFAAACEHLRKNNRTDDFIKVAERLLWHKSDNIELNRELATLYLRRNDARRALQKLQVCFKANPRDVETLALLAKAFQALDQKGKTVSVLKEMARILSEDNKLDEAREVHRKILAFVPGDRESKEFLEKRGAPAAPAAAPARTAPGRFQFTQSDMPPPSTRLTGAVPLVRAPEDLPVRGAAARRDLPVDDPASRSPAGGRAVPRRNRPGSYDESEVGAESRDPSAVSYIDPADFEDEESQLSGVEDEPASDLSLEDDSEESSTGVGADERAEEILKILTEADVYTKYGLHQKAIDHVRKVFAFDPGNVEARERLKDILLAQGREDEAIQELLQLARQHAAADPGRAELYLRELLGAEPAHQEALELAERYRLNLTGSADVEAADDFEGSSYDLETSARGRADSELSEFDEEYSFEDLELDSQVAEAAPRAAPETLDESEFADLDYQRRPGRSRAEPLPGAGKPSLDLTESARPARRLTSILESAEAGTDDGRSFAPGRPGQDVTQEVSIDQVEEAVEFDDDPLSYPGSRSAVVPVADDAISFDDASAFGAEPLDEVPGLDAGVPTVGGGVARERSAPHGRSPAAARMEEPQFVPAARDDLDDADYGADPDLFGTGAGGGRAPEIFDEFAPEDEPPASNLTVSPSDDFSDAAATEFVPPPEFAGPSFDEFASPPEPGGDFGQELGDDDLEMATPVGPADGEMPASGAEEGGDGVEDDLDEADFFISQGLYGEARDILVGLLEASPGHTLIKAKLADLDEMIRSQGGAEPDFELPASALSAAPPGRAASPAAGGPGRPAVLLEKPVADEDADTHYDLGLAYKEMGLNDEAINAFKKVIHVRGREVQCHLMIGLCLRDKRSYSESIAQFKSGLYVEGISEREKHTLYYEIGTTYEALKDPQEALYYFEMVAKKDPKYRDVSERVTRLKAESGPARSVRRRDDEIESLDPAVGSESSRS